MALPTRAVYRHALDLRELVDRRGRESLLVFGDPLAADPLEVADRGGESDRAFDVRRPRFELVRDLVVGGMIVPHARDHLAPAVRSEEHTSELQSLTNLVCRLLLEKKKK